MARGWQINGFEFSNLHNYEMEEYKLKRLYIKDVEKICKRERNWDVKISDYILEKFTNIPMFVDAEHPSKYLMKEIGRRIAAMLKIDDIDDRKYESGLGIPQHILPCVKRYYNIDYQFESEPFKCPITGDKNLSIEKYIKVYMWIFHKYVF